jgi:hypothetical protein
VSSANRRISRLRVAPTREHWGRYGEQFDYDADTRERILGEVAASQPLPGPCRTVSR